MRQTAATDAVGLGGDGRSDPGAERGGRLERLERLGEVGNDTAELVELDMRLRAGREVEPHGLHLVGVEGAEHEPGGEVADLVAGRGAAWPDDRSCRTRPVRSGADVVAGQGPAQARSPSRIRLLTVPSGAPVRSAISCWVSPPK